MTTVLETPQTSADPQAGHGDDHGHHDHPFLAHHFDSHQHQFDSGKLGIWLFLITEVLFFSGLFCAYTIYRVNHPEIFLVGHEFLDKQMGAINTIVLLFSSLTMAWGVRCAQLGQKQGLILCLSLTLACAGVFLVIKYFEYSAKISHGVLWASQFNAKEAAHYLAEHHGDVNSDSHAEQVAAQQAVHHEEEVEGAVRPENDAHAPAPADAAAAAEGDGHATSTASTANEHDPDLPKNLGVFFSIYFALTGLHGIHILAGMAAIGWVLRRAIRGDFGPEYFGPVDFVGLYWHLVDLIWIYLFPLLYLIH